VGTSGSGKSYAVKLDLLRTLMRKPDAWIYCVDPLREFAQATEAMGGQVIFLGNAESILNPFELAHLPPSEDGAPRENAYLWKLSMLGVFFDVLLPTLDGYERSVLLLSVQDAFAEAGIVEDPATHSNTPPTLATFVDLLRRNAQAPEDPRRAQASQNLATYLQPLLAGSLRGLVGQTTISLRSNVVTFDLKSLDRHWFPLYMYVVIDFIERRFFQDAKAPKRLVVDEAWNLLDHESTAQALDRLSRHLRHYRAGLTLVTQTPQSFLQSEHGQAILSNCLQTFLFRQRHVSPEVRDAYGLEEDDADLLTRMGTGESIQHSECLFIAGNNKSYLAVFASPAEDAIVRSIPEAKAQAAAA
jgi:type IV secretory pathway VirB4 component